MVSESTRNFVWQGLLDMARYFRYYSLLEQRYFRLHNFTRGALATAGFISALPLVANVPQALPAIGGFAVIGLIVLDLVKDYGKRAAALRVVAGEFNRLEILHRSLWEEVQSDSVSDDEARRRTEKLHIEALDYARTLDIPRDDKTNRKSQRDACKSEADRYAHG